MTLISTTVKVKVLSASVRHSDNVHVDHGDTDVDDDDHDDVVICCERESALGKCRAMGVGAKPANS